MKKINFKSQGLTLRGHLFLADKPKDMAFLFLAGWTGKQNTLAAQMLADHGFSAMTFDSAGHDSSEGKLEDYTIADFLDFATDAYDFFKSQLPEGHKIGLIGNSFGGYLAPMLSTRRPVAAISMRVPANYPDADFNDAKAKHFNEDERYSLEEWRVHKATPKDNMALKALADFKGPIQIIRAEKDDSVGAQTVENYVAAAKNNPKLEYIVWKNAPHSIGYDKKLQKEFEDYLLNWANKI